ncbi:carbohydrate ABC transporter permease [Labrys wisconsinensis]|uniref:Glucose/mannose transport system permease protein n=1 Tax=Labrys wisconsinensis TaxID=425677 RepID=A0ABU0JKI5_9HYPH|nr:carbohydrate ABC transporter permease [Labrys wisconsinensis]MDQ0474802.1 glucose/mannose transport system permease protein [Labrys wisconsinensis]
MTATTAPVREPASPGGHSLGTKIFIYGLLALFAFVYLVPLFVMLVTSFKTMDEIQGGTMLALPRSPTIVPWIKAWGGTCDGDACTSGVASHFWNSLKMVIPAVAISTALGAINGYVLTKWRFRGHKLVFGMMLFACFIPFQAVLLPVSSIFNLLSQLDRWLAEHVLHFSIGLTNSTFKLVFVHVIYGLGFTTLFFRNYYEAFPNELIKAAMIDGASFWKIFSRIILPSSLPIIVVTVIYQFTNIWNDFLFASAYAGEEAVSPITVALSNIVNTSTGVIEYNVNMAAAMIAGLPTLIVYVVAGRYFVRGLMAGAVKG